MGTVWMVAIGASATAQTPFNIPWNATGEGTASLRHLNPEPARQRIVAREGHLFNERGERVRFWGANIVGTSAFASKEVTDAAVKRLVMFGVNNVRLHHIDAWWLEENLFGPKPRETTRRLDPGIMDRLDYFIATCKAHGIYVNLNLLCSREFAPGDGLPEAFYSIPWKRSHQVGFWDAQARDLHKEFARQILTHRN
ncbi:MAG TPA: hypothetical protein PKB10_02190, partial [Tepidisphaeraceae bacterium]|nr:hypothetical protein [Tepidisphaeraceae bacterium]